jgi:hypothetical protein
MAREIAEKAARDRQAIEGMANTAKSMQAQLELCSPAISKPSDTFLPYTSSWREGVAEQSRRPLPYMTPILEQIANSIKPQGTPGHTIETRGRKRKWDWERADLAVIGEIYRGERPEPKTQADIERRLAEWFFAQHGSAPGESQIREHARLIWREIPEAGN